LQHTLKPGLRSFAIALVLRDAARRTIDSAANSRLLGYSWSTRLYMVRALAGERRSLVRMSPARSNAVPAKMCCGYVVANLS
jgi:hypothetical protein